MILMLEKKAFFYTLLLKVTIADDFNLNPCNPNPCQNNQLCQYIEYDDFNFTCTNAQDLCQTNQCLNGGTCYPNGPNEYRCDCLFGYSGYHCDIYSTDYIPENPTPNNDPSVKTYNDIDIQGLCLGLGLGLPILMIPLIGICILLCLKEERNAFNTVRSENKNASSQKSFLKINNTLNNLHETEEA